MQLMVQALYRRMEIPQLGIFLGSAVGSLVLFRDKIARMDWACEQRRAAVEELAGGRRELPGAVT